MKPTSDLGPLPTVHARIEAAFADLERRQVYDNRVRTFAAFCRELLAENAELRQRVADLEAAAELALKACLENVAMACYKDEKILLEAVIAIRPLLAAKGEATS